MNAYEYLDSHGKIPNSDKLKTKALACIRLCVTPRQLITADSYINRVYAAVCKEEGGKKAKEVTDVLDFVWESKGKQLTTGFTKCESLRYG